LWWVGEGKTTTTATAKADPCGMTIQNNTKSKTKKSQALRMTDVGKIQFFGMFIEVR
jgi:hypothetical protein